MIQQSASKVCIQVCSAILRSVYMRTLTVVIGPVEFTPVDVAVKVTVSGP
mgnify:CR=1 FL=1